jgi:hypothetical protein
MKRPVLPICYVICLLVATSTLTLARIVVIGGTNGPNGFPFGVNPEGIHYGPGNEYQQIYSASSFDGPMIITAIAFASANQMENVPGPANYNFRLGLGVTSVSPAAPLANFSANGQTMQVFNGALSAVLTDTNNFDLIITLATPFLYDPAGGNLLLDVVLNLDSTGSTKFFVAGNSPDVGRVFQFAGNGGTEAEPHYGLLTQFVTKDIPEPNTWACLAIGALFLVFSRSLKRQLSDL